MALVFLVKLTTNGTRAVLFAEEGEVKLLIFGRPLFTKVLLFYKPGLFWMLLVLLPVLFTLSLRVCKTHCIRSNIV